MEGVRKRLLRLPVLPELELVLEGEELWTPTVLLEVGEDGRESCRRLILLLNIGSRDTMIERLDPESPIRTSIPWPGSAYVKICMSGEEETCVTIAFRLRRKQRNSDTVEPRKLNALKLVHFGSQTIKNRK